MEQQNTQGYKKSILQENILNVFTQNLFIMAPIIPNINN